MAYSNPGLGVPPAHDAAPSSARLDAMAASAEIGERARKLRRTIVLVMLSLGMGTSAIAYALLRDFFLEHAGFSSPIGVGTLTFLPLCGGALALVRPLSRHLVGKNKPRWVEEAAARHGLSHADLAELTELVGA